MGVFRDIVDRISPGFHCGSPHIGLKLVALVLSAGRGGSATFPPSVAIDLGDGCGAKTAATVDAILQRRLRVNNMRAPEEDV